MKAKVYKSTGSWYLVKTPEGISWNARIKGIFKIEGITSTNPLAVGDEVEIEPEDGSRERAVIQSIQPRKNEINRQSPSTRSQHHVVAANLDQALLICTLKEPRTSRGFVDRFLVACEAYHIPAVIVLNKIDLYGKKEQATEESWRSVYTKVGYVFLPTSLPQGRGLEAFRQCLEGRITLLCGHSGVGKSSLINQISPTLSLKTHSVSGWSGKGIHTTTFAEMFDLPFGGQIIDIPGLREFGLVDISPQELSHYFPEMRSRIGSCRFNNCLHVNEPGCAIKKALEEGIISEDRYVSYCNILETLGSPAY
jgi:ribosome biogenesis GTPase